MRTVDHEAQLIAKNDAKFLANLTGSSWRLKPGSGSRCSSPAGTLSSPSTTQKQSPAKASSAAAAAPSTASKAARIRQLASAPTLHKQQPAHACTSPQQHGAAEAAGTPSADQDEEDLSDTSRNTADNMLQQQHQQLQQLPASPLGNRATRESPQWLLHTAKQGPGSAGPRAMHGPVHAESSLYSSWAASKQAYRSAAATSTTLLTRSQPSSPTPALLSSAKAPSHGRRANQYPHSAGAELSSPSGTAGARRSASPSSQPVTLTAHAAGAAADTAAEAAALLPGSPCGSNFHNTRAAGAAAGISRAGAVSPEHRDWFKQHHPRAIPPRREDTQLLWQWLADELQQLKQQLLQPSAQQQQAQAQLVQQPQQCNGQQQQQQQQPQSSVSAGDQPRTGTNRPRATTGGVAAAAATATPQGPSSAGINSCSRSGSPLPRPRSISPGRARAAADGCVMTSTPSPLEQQVQVLTQLCRGADGMLQAECVQLQQDLFAAAFHEVCRQVSVGCRDRGALMTQLWSAHDVLLQAALQDRLVLQQQCAEADGATAAALQEQQRLRQLAEDERVALRAINERHAARADTAKQDYEQLKLQHANLQELLKRLSGAQQLVQRVMDLEASHQQQELALQQQRLQLAAQDEQLEKTSAQLLHWQARAQAAEQQVVQQAQQLGCSTPRPKRDLGLLCDLVEPLHQQLIERALVAGFPAHHVHRLLLGLSNTGQDLRPWLPLAGTCLSALQDASDTLLLHQLLKQHLADCNAAALSKHLSTPDALQLLSQAVHVGIDIDSLISLLDGSLGLPALSQTASLLGCFSAANASQQQPQTRASMAAVSGAASTAAAAAVSSIGLGMQFLPLVGVLASKYGHNAREIGGPVTEALVQAQLSTVARVQDMEARCRAMHREVVMLKCTLAEQRKQEQERVDAALKDQKRKFARREARQPTPLEKFLQTKWGTIFTGIGMSEDIPRALRASTPINNKQMSKREAEKLASEIWAFKDEHEAATACAISLPEATAVFLERRFFAIPRLVTEVAYNLLYSLGQHTYDTDCNLFLRVFSGEVDESVRREQQLLEGEIMRLLKLLDMSINHQATGWLHKVDVKTALAGFFKGKKVDRLTEVLEALDTDEPGEALHYTGLFSDDENLSQGLTAEIIRSQHLTERLEFLQEIEDVIRDAAEDNGTTSLTPAMLEACLRKIPHKRLDSATVSEYTARAFGPDWENQRHRLAQPLGAIIRAVRSGGLPNMVRPAAGPSNVAGAVNRIVPVGKFKNKLVSALKVGFSKDAVPGNAAATGPAGAAAAAAPKGVRSRRATQEAVSAAIAAVLSGDGSTTRAKHKQAAQAAAGVVADADSSAGPERLVSGDDAAAGTAGSEAGDAQQAALQDVLVSGLQHGSDQQEGGTRPSTASEGVNSSSRPASSKPQLQVMVPDEPAAAVDLLSPASRSGKSTAPVTPSAAAARASMMAAARNSAQARALTVDMLSAMEAARQSWLKEEGDRMVSFSNSGGQLSAAAGPSAGTGAAREGPSAWLQQQSVPGGSGPAAAGSAALLDNHGMLRMEYAGPSSAVFAAASASTPRSPYTSSSGGSRQYTMPAVPALRLSDVLPIAEATGSTSYVSLTGSNSVGGTYRSTGSSVPCSGRGSSCEGSSYARSTAGCPAGGSAAGHNGGEAPNSSRTLLQQHSVKPILLSSSGQESHKPAKHVQINTEDTVFAFRPTSDASTAEADNMPQQQQQQLGPQQQQQQQQQHLAPPGGLLSPHSPQSGRQLPTVSGWGGQRDNASAGDAAPAAAAVPDAAAVGTPVAAGPVSRSSSGTSRQLESSRSKSSLRAGSGSTTPRSSKQPGAGADPSGSPATHAVKRRSSKSALLAAQLPQLLLTDADDACAAELNTPAGADGEHDHVCFTPQAPEEGGKRNAILMRRLNKAKSLKQLEEVMLAVAGGDFAMD